MLFRTTYRFWNCFYC